MTVQQRMQPPLLNSARLVCRNRLERQKRAIHINYAKEHSLVRTRLSPLLPSHNYEIRSI